MTWAEIYELLSGYTMVVATIFGAIAFTVLLVACVVVPAILIVAYIWNNHLFFWWIRRKENKRKIDRDKAKKM